MTNTIHNRECQRLRRHIDLLRNQVGELELRLEGFQEREKLAVKVASDPGPVNTRGAIPVSHVPREGTRVIAPGRARHSTLARNVGRRS